MVSQQEIRQGNGERIRRGSVPGGRELCQPRDRRIYTATTKLLLLLLLLVSRAEWKNASKPPGLDSCLLWVPPPPTEDKESTSCGSSRCDAGEEIPAAQPCARAGTSYSQTAATSKTTG